MLPHLSHHLNNSKIHLNENGTKLSGKTFVMRISDIFDPCSDLCTTANKHRESIQQIIAYSDNLKFVRKDDINNVIIAHLNINSLRNKINFLSEKEKGNIDILMVSETKLDDTFPEEEFLIEGFGTPFRFDRNRNGGGIMLCVREDIPTRFLSAEKAPIEAFFVEFNFQKTKWLLSCSYNPHKNSINSHIESLSKCLDVYIRMSILSF